MAWLRHRARHHAADVVVVAEGLHERDDLAVVEHRHGHAQVRAGGRCRPRTGRRRCGSRRRPGASSRAGSRARRAARAPSTSGPVSLRSRRSWMPARKSCWSRIIGERAVRPIASSTSASIEAERALDDLDDGSGRSRPSARPGPPRCRSRRRARAEARDGSAVVEPNSSITAGPVDRVAGAEPLARVHGASCRRGRRSTPRRVPTSRVGLAVLGATGVAATGRSIAPTPVTRRFTHSTTWRGSSR